MKTYFVPTHLEKSHSGDRTTRKKIFNEEIFACCKWTPFDVCDFNTPRDVTVDRSAQYPEGLFSPGNRRNVKVLQCPPNWKCLGLIAL